jgi:hypothetical protein
MFEWASSFEQDLSAWDLSDNKVVDAFRGAQMPDAYYPVGCNDDSECLGESLHSHAFFDTWELHEEMLKYTDMGQVAWAESDCYGVLCHSYYGYAKLLT